MDNPTMSSHEDRRLRVDIRSCIDPTCPGELYEIEWYENVNWVTAVFKCALCKKEFTVKVEA